MNLPPYSDLLLRMPLPPHTVHTARGKVGMVNSKISICIENDCLKEKLTLRCQFLWCSPITRQQWQSANSQAKLELQCTTHSALLGFAFIDLEKGWCPRRCKIQGTKEAILQRKPLEFLRRGTAPSKFETGHLFQVCIFQSFQGRDVCLDTPSPPHLSGGGG